MASISSSSGDDEGIFNNELTPLIVPLEDKNVKSYNSIQAVHKRRIRAKARLNAFLDKRKVRVAQSHDQRDIFQEPSPVDDTTPLCQDSSGSKVITSTFPTYQTSHRSPFQNISLTLENSGSVARDHLASERTFLAYVRTSIAIASSGVGLVQLFTVASANLHQFPEHRIHHYIRPLGALTIMIGLIVLIIGVVRYFSIQTALTKGNFPVARAAAAFITTILTLVVVVTFGILMTGKLEPHGGHH